MQLVAPLRERAAPRIEGRVGGRAAARRLVPDVRRLVGQQQAGEGLEHLDDVDLARLQRLDVARHGLVGDALDAEPGSMPASRRSCCRQSHGVGTSLTVASFTDLRSASLKSGRGGRRPISRKGSRVDDLAEADDVAARHLLVGLHHPHRPAPADIDRAVHQPQRGVLRPRRARELDLDALGRRRRRARGRHRTARRRWRAATLEG